ncbi:hypothetical protein [Streptomyces sp. NPDC096193]|uniref:hypothetical protein n=1 Tax=Streptomyces sp. NPDC096193 TaxID=3155821 RepID=UPI00331BA247
MIGKTAWPANVLYRFPTIVGATVDVIPQPSANYPDRHASVCQGCDETYDNPACGMHQLKGWAQAHPETCRALPRPTA